MGKTTRPTRPVSDDDDEATGEKVDSSCGWFPEGAWLVLGLGLKTKPVGTPLLVTDGDVVGSTDGERLIGALVLTVEKIVGAAE